ncbi:MAG: class I SAM-dependent methyltransferase [Gammaproteobacteria bacterium]|nr:class I SAM-dependent methyltransferase [Gammaproteobacteria bacterium]MDH3536803.1 class I SAM-dependent methyltransferase [Gammaproteobacteria bacterium]
MILNAVLAVFLFMTLVALFFFTVTRGALLLRALSAGAAGEKSHVYPIYSDMRLIKLIDYQPVISAILLFQYHRLVAKITSTIAGLDLAGRKVLITSCAFGNVIPEVARASMAAGAERVLVADIIKNELVHARGKLDRFAGRIDFLEDDATNMQLAEGAVDVNVVFFLLHELPHPMKLLAMNEAVRTLAPGGTLLIGEFHRPSTWVLRALSWTYFKVFEPYGLALWGSHDPVDYLQSVGGWSFERNTYFFGNFQVITATKLHSA